MRILTFCLLALLLPPSAIARDILFQDGFEEGTLGSAWTVATTNQGRVAVRGDYGPASGSGQLVFDDSVSDAVNSRSTATFAVDLTGKKDAFLTFKVKNIGDEAHWPWFSLNDSDFDGVAVSSDGGVTWETVEWLGDRGPDWREVSIPLSPGGIVGGLVRVQGPCLIRFSQYDNAPVPFDGISIDDVSVTAVADQRVIVETQWAVDEGGGPYTGQVLLSFPMAEPLTVAFSQDSENSLTLPGSVVIPAGEVSASFEFSVKDDTKVNPGRYASLEPVVAGEIFTLVGCYMSVTDDEPSPIASLSLPASVNEGSPSVTATVSISEPAAVDLKFSLNASPVGQLWFPDEVTIPAGQLSEIFSVGGQNDSEVDGNVSVQLTLRRQGMPSVTKDILVVDRNVPVLSIEMPVSVSEGAAARGTVKLSDAMTSGTTVYLSSDSSRLSVPAWVFIPAGGKSVEFDATAPDDPLRNLGENVTIHAEASGLGSVSRGIRLVDDEPAVTASLSLPAELTEGATVPETNALFRLSAPLDVDQYVRFTGGDSRIQIPSYLLLQAGEQELRFVVKATENSLIDDGPVTSLVTAECTAVPTLSASVLVRDNEERTLSLPSIGNLVEGKSHDAYVEISGYLGRPLEVTLTSADPSVLSMPPSVIIPAGARWVSFPVLSVDNTSRGGVPEIAFTASAAGFVSGETSLSVSDNDPVAYRFDPLTELVDAGNLNIRLSALDGDSGYMAGPVVPVALSVISDQPGIAPVPLPTVAFDGWGVWFGKLSLPALVGEVFRLRVTDAAGVTADSTPFRVMRSTGMVAKSLVYDPSRSLLFASVSQASSLHPKRIVAINPQTLEITGTLVLAQEPGQMVLTDDGSWLYVAIDSNGTILRINPATLAIDKTFAVGTDPSYPYGTLYARDIMVLPGNPDTLVVARRRNAPQYDAGVVVYDNGVLRSTFSQESNEAQWIEPSPDPNTIYSYKAGSAYSLRRMTIGPSGAAQTGNAIDLLNVYGSEMVSDGNRLVWFSGHTVDGSTMTHLGKFEMEQDYMFSAARPEMARGRVYFLGKGYYNGVSHASAFDPASKKPVNRLSMPDMRPRGDLIRWGANGFAFRTDSSVVVMDRSPLVPDAPPADLSVSIAPSTSRVLSGQPVDSTIIVTNQGPNPAEDVWVTVNLSEGQTVTAATGGTGNAVVDGLVVKFAVGEIPAGSSSMLTLTTTPSSPGPLSMEVAAITSSIDADMADNNAARQVIAEFDSARDQVRSIRLDVSKLVNDPVRGLLWAATTPRVAGSLASSLVSIDPLTGAIVPVASLPAASRVESMAISGNCRYLYVGLGDGAAVVRRYDLSISPPTLLNIPLGSTTSGYLRNAVDIEVLDGAGTSFLMADSADSVAMVYDQNVRRAMTGSWTIDQIERGSAAGTFVGYYGSSVKRIDLQGSSIQLSTTSSAYGRTPFFMHASGTSLLVSSGEILDVPTRTRRFGTGSAGVPCADEPYRRAYICQNNQVKIHDLTDGKLIASIPISPTTSNYEPYAAVRWGPDGLAVASVHGPLHIIRTSHAVPADADANLDGIADAWAMKNFPSVTVPPARDSDGDGITDALEYLFGTRPMERDASPLGMSAAWDGTKHRIELSLQRRSGMSRSRYAYEVSDDLANWTEVQPVESVTGSAMSHGDAVDLLEVTVDPPQPGRGFVRMRWKP